ncbi:MAG: hypothetical protein KGM47_17485, partial [Acidobacteriota bacterium]|nr:hypothetical protein [Acidobacteriota bacterium]
MDRTDRRTLLKKLAGAAMATSLPPVGFGEGSEAGAASEASPEATLTLDDSDLRATFDQATGALTGIEYKPTGWQLLRRPDLGVSFRMQAPLPGRHDNFILGQRQRAARAEKRGNQA